MVWSVALLCLLLAPWTVRALYVTDGSPCWSTCNGTNGTWYPDVVCADSDFSSYSKGQLLEQCLQCEMKSLYVNGTKSDEYWFLFHLKFIQEACLIDTQNPHTVGAQQCATECNPLRTTLDTLWIHSTPFLPQYNYCTVDADAYPTYGPNCAKCLQAQNGTVIVGNMVETMVNACVDQPLAVNGQLVTTSRDLFDTAVVPTTSSSSSTSTSAVTSTTSATSTSTSTSTSTLTSTSTATVSPGGSSADDSGSRGLSGGAAAGIGIGAAVALIAVAAILFLLARRKKRRTPAWESMNSQSQHSDSNTDVKDGKQERLYREMPDNPLVEMDGYEMSQAHGRHNEKMALVAELPGH